MRQILGSFWFTRVLELIQYCLLSAKQLYHILRFSPYLETFLGNIDFKGQGLERIICKKHFDVSKRKMDRSQIWSLMVSYSVQKFTFKFFVACLLLFVIAVKS